jgi:hypothetical protein
MSHAVRNWLAVACLLAAFELSAKLSGDAAAVLCLSGMPAWPRELLTSIAAFAAVTWPLLVAEHFYPGTNSPARVRAGRSLLADIARRDLPVLESRGVGDRRAGRASVVSMAIDQRIEP